MATKTWQNGGVDNNWSTAGNWVEGSKPADGDDVIMAANYNCNHNEDTANLRSFDMTGYPATFTGSIRAINIIGEAGTTQNVILNGFTGSITISPTLPANAAINFYSNGESFTSLIFSGGTLNLMDALNVSSGTLTVGGVLNTNNYSISAFLINIASGGTLNAGNSTIAAGSMQATGGVFNMGTSTITFSTSNGKTYPPYYCTGTTINCGTSNMIFTSTGSAGFTGGNKTYYNVSWTGANNGMSDIRDSNTFNKISITAPRKLTPTAGVTLTVNKVSFIGKLGSLITLNPSSAATLTKIGGGTIQCEWLSITNTNVTPANTWYYGNHTTYVSGTGWKAGPPPNFL